MMRAAKLAYCGTRSDVQKNTNSTPGIGKYGLIRKVIIDQTGNRRSEDVEGQFFWYHSQHSDQIMVYDKTRAHIAIVARNGMSTLGWASHRLLLKQPLDNRLSKDRLVVWAATYQSWPV
jgi:hypothetical protein